MRRPKAYLRKDCGVRNRLQCICVKLPVFSAHLHNFSLAFLNSFYHAKSNPGRQVGTEKPRVSRLR